MSDNLPLLPKELLDLIGEYGMARTDFGVGTPSHIKSYSDLIAGIKAYARAALAQAQSCVPAAWREAAQEFVDRCDAGEVRSVKTYTKFKALLAASPQPQPVQPEDSGAHAAWTSHATNRKEKFTTLNHQNTFFAGWIACRTALASYPPVAQAKPEQPQKDAP